MIFPKFDNAEVIDELRREFDPLYKHVPPHLTLVFPFDSNIQAIQLQKHLIKSLKGLDEFHLQLQGISGAEGKYLFLNVVQGQAELKELQKRLYSGILEQYLPGFLDLDRYSPHLTVGRIADRTEFEAALNKFSGKNDIFNDEIKQISVEVIDENEDSIIEMTLNIGKEDANDAIRNANINRL